MSFLKSILGRRGSEQNHPRIPEVGFKLILENVPNELKPSTLTPELLVNLIGVRNLPASFGVRAIEGHIIQVKLYPGSVKQDLIIHVGSMPPYNETFRFPLADGKKKSGNFLNKLIKRRKPYEIHPETIFKGNFISFRIYALLEIPPGVSFSKFLIPDKFIPTIIRYYFNQQGSQRLKKNTGDVDDDDDDTPSNENMVLNKRKSQRIVGSVSYHLDPVAFHEVCQGQLYQTEEMWLPIKDIWAKKRAEVEITLQLCDYTDINLDDDNPSQNDDTPSTSLSCFGGVKRNLCLKVSTAKFRCSQQVIREFVAVSETIYLKTSVLKYGMLTSWWKSEPFQPTFSARWNPDDCTIEFPLSSMAELARITIRGYVAAIDTTGKKVYLGEFKLGPKASRMIKNEHWQKMITSKGTPVSEWHKFE